MRRREAPSHKAKLFILPTAGVVYFFTMFEEIQSDIQSFVYPQNLLTPTIRDLEMLESSGFHQNVDLSSLLSKFISDFENPSQKTRERNYKHCVSLYERTIKARNLRFGAKCRH